MQKFGTSSSLNSFSYYVYRRCMKAERTTLSFSRFLEKNRFGFKKRVAYEAHLHENCSGTRPTMPTVISGFFSDWRHSAGCQIKRFSAVTLSVPTIYLVRMG